MRLFDIHSHLADARFDEDRESVIERLREAGVARCIVVTDPTDDPPASEQTLRDILGRPGFSLSFGVHPHNADSWNDAIEAAVAARCKQPDCVALGEIGLDYHYDLSPRDRQREVFARQLEMARGLGMPCQLHIRDAYGDAVDICSSLYRSGALPVCAAHCFSGSWETARQFLDMGMYISFSGSVTFENGRKLLETAKNVPLNRLLVETDCPYLAPVPMRGRRNEPAFVAHTARKVAQIRGMAEDELALAAFANACRLFGLDPNAA